MADNPDNVLVDASGNPLRNEQSKSRWNFKTILFLVIVTISLSAGVVAKFDSIATTFSKFLPAKNVEITDVLIYVAKPTDEKSTAGKAKVLDFRLVNNGNDTVTISSVRLTVISFEWKALWPDTPPTTSRLLPSATYDVDFATLTEADEAADIPVSHVLEPHKADRFLVHCAMPRSHSRVRYVWEIRPTLTTSHGEVEGPIIKMVHLEMGQPRF